MTNLTCASLAAGGGIYRAHGLPFRETFAVEIGKAAAAAFRENYPDTPVLEADASDPDVLQAACRNFNPPDIIISGMPCQDFTMAKSCDRINSEKNDLYIRALDWVERFRPRGYIAENVPNVARQIHWDMAVDRLRVLGYRVTAWNLNAKRFGVPQDRLRTFLIAVRDDISMPERPHETHGSKLLPFRSWRDAMEGISEEEALSEGFQRLSPKYKWILRGIPPQMDWAWIKKRIEIPGNRARLDYILDCFDGDPAGNRVARRLRIDEPCHTLLTAPSICRTMRTIHPGCLDADAEWQVCPLTGNIQIVAPNGRLVPIVSRLVSVKEFRRLFELPDTWKFPFKSTSKRYMVIGNGICPRVFRLVCESVARSIAR